MRIDAKQAAERLQTADNILILAHRRPDGDTLGSAFGLLYALEQLGKTARVECADPIPDSFSYFFPDYKYDPAVFAPEYIVAVDVATEFLLGRLHPVYGDKVNLTIDHHKSNTFFAKETYLDESAPAASQMMYHVVSQLGITFDKSISNPLFTGVVTDTGCFRYPSVTPETHRVAALLMECGAEHAMINRLMFETNSRERMQVETLVLESLEYHFDGLCATIYVDGAWQEEYGITDDDLTGLAAIPRTIEGVMAGVTIRDQKDGSFRISLRSHNPVDSSRICAVFDGGGHANAAGCTIRGEIEEVKQKLTHAVGEELERNGLWTGSF